jgi:hypothetical protein
MTPNTWQCDPVWQYNGLEVDMTQTHTCMSITVYERDLDRVLTLVDWLWKTYGKPATHFHADAPWVNRIRKTSTAVLKWTPTGKLRKLTSEQDTYEIQLTMNSEIFAVFKLTWGLTPLFA